MEILLLCFILIGVCALLYIKIKEVKMDKINPVESVIIDLLTKEEVEIIIKENNKEIDSIIHNKLNKLVFHLNDDNK